MASSKCYLLKHLGCQGLGLPSVHLKLVLHLPVHQSQLEFHLVAVTAVDIVPVQTLYILLEVMQSWLHLQVSEPD